MADSRTQRPVNLAAELERSRGTVIERVRRIRYVIDDQISDDNGPLELSWSSGQVLLFDAAHDGTTLEVRGEAWSDPFAEPLSAQNQGYVRKNGKWTAFDVSGEAPFDLLINSSIRSYETVFWSMANGIYKVVLHFGVRLTMAVGVDDLRVSVSSEESAN